LSWTNEGEEKSWWGWQDLNRQFLIPPLKLKAGPGGRGLLDLGGETS